MSVGNVTGMGVAHRFRDHSIPLSEDAPAICAPAPREECCPLPNLRHVALVGVPEVRLALGR